MSDFVPWNSQPLETWASKHAAGQFVELQGRKVHFIEQGHGDPVLLIHGFNLDSTTWTKNIGPLSSRFRVLAPDLWGHGYSSREPQDFGYQLYSEQVRLFMDALEIERASLVGHSMGGGTSVVFAKSNPERVEKLVLVDAAGIPAPLPFAARIFRLPGVAEFLLGLPTDYIRRKNLHDFWIHDRGLLTERYYQDFVRFQKIQGTTEALLRILRRNFFHTLREVFQAFGKQSMPVLISWGREDASVSLSSGQEMHRLIDGSRLEVFDEAGHMPNFEKPESFNNLLMEFLLEPVA